MNKESLMVGKRVCFSITKETKGEGIILDKISMISKHRTNNTDELITGYVIQEDDGNLWNSVAHWRILKVLD